MTYKASDIVRKAEQLADLTNTDFINWDEKISLLNDAYTMLYQKLVDIGDGSFVKPMIVYSGENILPPDFWQIKSVNLVQNKIVTPVKRRASSENYSSLSYEVRFDKLYINGTYSSGDIVVEYWAKPKTLTYKPNPVALAVPEMEDFTVIGVTDNKVISKKTEEVVESETTQPSENVTVETTVTSHKTTISIYDIKEQHEQTTEINGILDTILPSKDKAVYTSHEEITTVTVTTTTIAGQDPEVDTQTNTVTSEEAAYTLTYINMASVAFTGIPLIMENGTLGYVTDKIYVGRHALVDFDYETTGIKLIVSNNELYDFWWLDSENQIIHNGDVVLVNDEAIVADYLTYSNKNCWYNTDEEVGYFDEDENWHLVDDKPGVVGINKIDFNTGYGYTVETYGNIYNCFPWVEDTVLDFPNSMYFTIMSYMLAVQFKVKQGADAQGLLTVLQTLEYTFYDTLAQDANDFVRIKNVY